MVKTTYNISSVELLTDIDYLDEGIGCGSVKLG